MNDNVHTITEVDRSQQFFNLNMLERGLYATFLASDKETARYGTYFKEYGVMPVLNALNALVKDKHFRAETTVNPTKYTRSKGTLTETMEACLAIYQEVRDPAWANHKTVTRTLEKSLKAFIKQTGKDALDVFRRGLTAQKNGWARGKKLDLVNLMTNDKIIRLAEAIAPTPTTSGMVYRLSLSQPDPRLPKCSSYAIRVDAKRNGTVEGYVFPEGNPNEGVTTKVPAKAVATPLRDWTTYQQQHA